MHHPGHKWTKVRICMADKDAPLAILGHDPSLPQNRSSTSACSYEIRIGAGDEFPVCYFLYDTLASTARLSRLFE